MPIVFYLETFQTDWILSPKIPSYVFMDISVSRLSGRFAKNPEIIELLFENILKKPYNFKLKKKNFLK